MSMTCPRATAIGFVGGTRMSRKRSVRCGVRETRQPKPPWIAPTLTIAATPRYAFSGSASQVGIHSSTASITSRMRTIEFRSRLPSENAVWMKLPWVPMRSHSEPKCPSTTLPSVGSPRMHMSATPPWLTR